jgi:hypothetical protein
MDQPPPPSMCAHLLIRVPCVPVRHDARCGAHDVASITRANCFRLLPLAHPLPIGLPAAHTPRTRPIVLGSKHKQYMPSEGSFRVSGESRVLPTLSRLDTGRGVRQTPGVPVVYWSVRTAASLQVVHVADEGGLWAEVPAIAGTSPNEVSVRARSDRGAEAELSDDDL